MTKILIGVHSFIWGVPALLLVLGVGLYLSILTDFAQLKLFPRALRAFCAMFRGRKNGDGVSPFRALCTALAATVGTGNLIGVAGAICLGGPGSVFWMWLCAILGMMTKFAEVTLAVRYRTAENGEYVGGPMYMILNGMGKNRRMLAGCYCFFGVVAAFGVGNATQINAVVAGLNGILEPLGIIPDRRRDLAFGLILAVLVGTMLFGGARRIGAVAERLVPAASAIYIILCAGVLICRAEAVPGAFRDILRGAFSPRAVTGGIVGSGFQALKTGCSRGVFTNEAGMGTASIAHASAKTPHPAEQGLLGIMEVFLDTIVICTLTALVILSSGVPIPYGQDAGGTLTSEAFAWVCGDGVRVFLACAMCCFAFATVLGWGLYGARCAQFLFGNTAWETFALLQTATVVLGAVLNTQTVWLLAESVNGLMAIPNLIALAYLSPELVRLTVEYKEKSGKNIASGGNHANFHQCKPLRTISHAEIPSLCRSGGKSGKEDLSSEHRSA